jgi:hypothetical protein
VQVVSLDWKWLFIYPQQGIATVNQLVVPVGTPVHFSITSASVFNTFFVPRMGSMIYAMPGMVSQLNLQADRPATFLGQSGHFSGDGFSDMQFQVRSVPPAEFAAWANAVRSTGRLLDLPAYAQLARQSHNVPPLAFRAVDPRLFHAIATQKIPPAPGPEPSNPRMPGGKSRRQGGNRHVRQAELVGDPVGPAHSPGHLAVLILVIDRRARPDRLQALVALSLARMDHQRRPQADRHHVHRCSAWSC